MSAALFTLCVAAGAGVLLICLANRLRVPSIVLLLLGGVLLGPEGLGLVDPGELGEGIKLVVGLAVAVILFEGGLSLDWRAAGQSIGVISRVLSIGVLVTWVGASATIYWLFDTPLSIAALCGSLVIVTGPTVVAPILRRINIRDRLKHVLYWESVAVDAIGVCIAVLCFEWVSPDTDHGTWSPLLRFAARFAVGVGLGGAMGWFISRLLRTYWVADEHVNIVVLGMALLAYATAEAVLSEAGVLAVIVTGFVLGTSRPRQLATLKRFELELTEMGVGTLFVVLAGTLRFDSFYSLGWRLAVAVALLALVVRPLAIVLSTWGRGFSVEERVFLAWMAPRGIVAAFLASLFALELGATEIYKSEALLIHTFTFAVIGSTVIAQGLTAPLVARLLHLEKSSPQTWLLVGDSALVRPLLSTLHAQEVSAVGLVHAHEVVEQDHAGTLIYADPLDSELLDDPRCSDVGTVVAISANLYFGELVCERWAEVVGESHCYIWSDTRPASTGTARFVGTPAWHAAGRPTEAAHRLEAGTLATEVMSVTEANCEHIGKHEAPLFRLRGEAVTILGTQGAALLSPGDLVVVIRDRVPGLEDLVVDATILDGTSIGMEEVVDALLGQAQLNMPELPREHLNEVIIERELVMSTAMGSGVAIPHAYHHSLDRPQCFVASVPQGVAGQTPDGEPIRMVFLVLSPRDQAGAHLRSLAAIARLCSDLDYLHEMEDETDGSRLLQWIRNRE